MKNDQTEKESKCRLCGALIHMAHHGTLLDHDIRYFECQECGYVQTEEPYWLEEAYSSVINATDTGILRRNAVNARIVIATACVLGKLQGRIVDSSGGYGILVRQLRDYGLDAYWSDPFCDNLFARGFEYDGKPADVVTSFEAFEHFKSPGEELDRLLAMAPILILSTLLIPEPTPEPQNWWYYGSEHGQHIGFFRVQSLERLARERGKYFVTDGVSYHCISDRRISPLLWKLIVRFNLVSPIIARFRLQSKVWSDFLLLSGRQNRQ